MLKQSQQSKIAFLFLALSLGACASSGKVLRRHEAKKIDYPSQQFVVMPVEVENIPGGEDEYNQAVAAGFVASLGTNAFSLQPAKSKLDEAGMAHLGRDLADAMQRSAASGNYDLKTSNDPQLAALAEKMAQVIQLASETGGLAFKPNYVAVAHIEGTGKGDLPETYDYRVVGAVYDVAAEKIHAVTSYEKTSVEKALKADMTTVGNEIITKLMAAEK